MVYYKKSTQLQNAQYIDREGNKFLEVTYDYDRKKINVAGVFNAEYGLKDNTYDNNNSLFYFFSQIYPEKNKPIIFMLLQSKLNRLVEMYLKHIGEEEIIVGGKKIRAVKYEMGVNEKIAYSFWPYKYYYWYDASNRQFLKYSGIGEDKKIQTIQVMKYSEK